MRKEPENSPFDVFRYRSAVAKDSDEIITFLPAGNQVEMEMIGYPAFGDCTDITADIQALQKEMIFIV